MKRKVLHIESTEYCGIYEDYMMEMPDDYIEENFEGLGELEGELRINYDLYDEEDEDYGEDYIPEVSSWFEDYDEDEHGEWAPDIIIDKK